MTMAHRRNGIFRNFSLLSRKQQDRVRAIGRYAHRSNLRIEPLEGRYAMHNGHIDLVDASDLGFSNTDDLTSATTWNVQATDVTAGATVRIMHGTDEIVRGDALAAVLNLNFSVAALPDGPITLFIEQDLHDGAGFVASPHTFTFTKDTTLADISTTPPTSLIIGADLNYDPAQAEEGQPNVVYSLVGAPAAATINPTTGLVSWTPAEADINTYSFGIKIVDAAGNEKTQNVNLTVTPTAPGAPDLTSASDSGASNTDNVTGAGTLTFTVGGLLASAQTVNLKLNGTIIGTASTGGASSVDVSVTNPGALAQGQLQITAEQVVDGIASPVSTALTITHDTQISAISSTPPTTATINAQLTYDAQHNEEGQAGFVYSLVNPPAGASIDASTGVLTWTPVSGQTGANAFQIRVTDLAGNTTTQSLNINVSSNVPATPNAPDLQAASDLGTSSTDNITSATAWTFDISGVTTGATVNLKHNGTVVASGVATGTTISLTINNVAQFADGDVQLVAEQVINSVASAASSPITVTKDTAIASITSTAPSFATAGQAFTYDPVNPDEGTNGFVYSLVNGPTGATINATTGVVTWTPSASNQVGAATFGIKTTDLAGNTKTQTVSLEVLRPLPALNAHIHADLSIFVNGVQVHLPNFLGLSQSGQIAFPHVEGTDDRIHVHPMDGTNATPDHNITLGDFFNTWRTNAGIPGNNPNATFSSTSLMGNNVVAGQSIVRMYVNGKESTEFENYVLRDEDDITLTFETVGQEATGGPTLAPIQDVTVFAGAPLYIPLNGFDPTNQALTFTATSSNTSILTTGINNSNPSMVISVAGFGDMTFELFQDKVPDVVNKIIALINAGKYDGTIFHRVINGFVIQGGDPNGNGQNDENQPEFDDEFNLDLQHTSSGLLSMAKAGDDTNTSQFFITDTATRFLDFQHSIFGRLTKGDDVRELISNVAVNNSTENRPITNVVMSKVQLITDTQNGVLMLKAPEGVTGTSDVTVTVTDSDGKTFQQTFHVTVAADTSNSPNSPPFLNPVNDVTTTQGQAVNVQLSSQDVENGTRFYAIDPNGIDGSNKPYTATINAATGLATITPNAGFVGTFNVTFGVRQDPTISTINDQWDTQTIQVTVTAGTPGVPDLLDASDTGISAQDNITKGGSWQFQVGNVVNGATVKLFAGNQLLAQTTASGTTATLSFDSSILADGQVQITSEQTSNGVTSARSLPLTITKDTVAPVAFDFTTPLPNTAIVGQQYSYSFVNSEEGTNFKYSLVNPPAGATINADTGALTWTPTTAQLGAQTFTVRFSDPAGNVRDQVVNATVVSDQQQLVQFTIFITDLQGNDITTIEQGEDFFVEVVVEDKRATPEGVFAAFADMTYDTSKVTAVTPITFGPDFANGHSGSLTTAGIVDEAGGVAGLTPLGAGQKSVYKVRFTATGQGTATFATNPADVTGHETLLWNVGTVIPNAQITHASGSLTVAAPTGAVTDELTVIEDSTNNTLNVLSNDTLPSGVNGPLTIQSVTQPATGGTVSIAQDNLTLIFTPTPDFAGETSFTYTVTNGAGFTDTATVNLTVSNTNDPPNAVDDTLSINEDAANSSLNVLANDTSLPDPSETLTITAVTQPTTGGTVSIANDGKSLIFNPTANFNGQVTFTYTINDGTAGSNDTATVTLNITPVNDPPVATNDAQTVAEDADTSTIDVLANDNAGPDGGETITVTAVTQGSNGGTVAIGTNGANITYKPAANFNGTETFTYTINDGHGGTATATVTMTVTPVNDPPNANDDTATMVKNGGPLTVNVLTNDTIAPDTGETLTVTAVTQPTTGGTVTIASDGKSVIFTPTNNFSGTVTFTYTINDGTTGSNDTANVTITVQDFIPSDIIGYVYIDANNNGVKDAGEVGIAGIVITLAGSSSVGSVNKTATTLADGSYLFNNIAPGSYTITETQPIFMVDGADRLGTHGGNTVANDKLGFTIPQDSHLRNYNFGELGRQARFVTMKDFLTSTPVSASMAAIMTNGNSAWVQLGPSYAAGTTATAVVSNGQLTMTITENGQQFKAIMSMTDASKVQKVGTDGGAMLLRILGTRQSLGFAPVVTQSSLINTNDNSGDNSSGASGEAPATSSLPNTADDATNNVPTQSDLPDGDGEEGLLDNVPSFVGPSFSNTALATAAINTLPLGAPASQPISTFVGPSLSSSYLSTSSSSGASYNSVVTGDSSSSYANGSSSYIATTSDGEAEGDKPDSDDGESEEAPRAESSQAARDEAVESWNDDAWTWWQQQDEHDGEEEETAPSEQQIVDAVMAQGDWEA
jgi:cyclophilin family peptidyl-prolyl cis-trans isomerase